MADLRDLTARFATVGTLQAIVLRPARGRGAVEVESAETLANLGLVGDRASEGRGGGGRQVTLFQAEHAALVAAWAGDASVTPTALRRNLWVAGLNLLAARSPFSDRPLTLAIGAQVRLQLTGPCDPCSKMEAALGAGAYNALRGHGGLTARVLRGGWVQRGDAVRVEPPGGD